MSWRLAVFLLASLPLLAQSNGTINGDVTDATGAAVPAAKVKIKSVAIGFERDAATGENGSFTVPNLPGGDYEVSIEAAGFKLLVRSGIRLDTDQAVTLKLQLEVGQITERVEVVGNATPVDTNSGDVSRLVTQTQLQNYALPGRNPYYMLGILPGIISRYGNFTTDFRATSYSMGALMINGGRKDTNFVTLDGINNGRTRDGVQVNNILGVDFIEEVKVYTSRYAPEFGRNTGAQINFITRRATQDYHLSAYEFFLSDQFAANRFVLNDRPRTRYHDYGFTLGGPIFIPKKWNTDKSKLFLFFGYEARYVAGTNTKTSIVPTPLERAGNFSQSKTAPTDPSSGLPFPGNIIPSNRISNLGQALQKIYPDPNYTGPGGNFIATRDQPTDNGDIIFRADYNIRQNWQLSVRGLHGDQNFTSQFDNTGNNIPLFPVYRHRRGNNFAVALNNTISPSMVNELTLGESDYREDFSLQGNGYSRQTWGVTYPQLYGGSNGNRMPGVSFSNITGITGSNQPSYARTPTFILRDNFTKIRGSHTLKTGFYAERLRMNELSGANDNGSFAFGDTSSNPRNSGVPWANGLLGNFDTYSESGPPAQTIYKAYVFELYAQDSWRVSKRFTLEYGMRYALISPWSSLWNNEVAFMQQFWDPAKAPQVAANGTIMPGTGDPYNGLVLPGSGFPSGAVDRLAAAKDPAIKALFRGVPEAFNPLQKGNFQPRLSFAWDVFGDGKMAVRAGGGVFQGMTGIAYSGWYLGGARAPLVQSTTVANGSADNPGSGIPNTTLTPINAGALPATYKIPTVYTYSIGIQRQLPLMTVVDLSYVGNRGRHLSFSRELNYLPPEQVALHQGVDTRPFLPYRGLGGLSIVEPVATSSYDSMQFLLKRRTRDLSYSFAYTLGKNIGYGIEGVVGGAQDPRNIRPQRSELEESRRHYIVVTHTYDTPWFRSQKGFAGRVLGGWSLNGLWTWTTGRLYAPTLTGAPRQVANRPNVVGAWELPADQRTPFRWFNTAAFARPADYAYGNSGTWVIRGPGTFDLSAFALKEVRVLEQARLQLRIEAFNALNHPYWTDVNTTLGQSNFGQVGGVSSQRYIQLGAKFFW
jgi:Carboxypeptidase regulatory-like domain